MENITKKIIMVSGKARHGKDTFTEMITNEIKAKGLKCINLQYSSYIKEYAKKISDWDGSEETKPRELLQQLGTNIIRKQIDELFFVNRIIEDIKVYSYFFDVITISDCRAKVEIDLPKKAFDNVYAVHVVRPNFDNGLTEEQKKHFTEIDLDDYNNFDCEILNDGSCEDLNKKAKLFVEEVIK